MLIMVPETLQHQGLVEMLRRFNLLFPFLIMSAMPRPDSIAVIRLSPSS
ncbi:MAG: hypothetical protein ACR5LD_09280 [Symbiopectobacterium sp.]